MKDLLRPVIHMIYSTTNQNENRFEIEVSAIMLKQG